LLVDHIDALTFVISTKARLGLVRPSPLNATTQVGFDQGLGDPQTVVAETTGFILGGGGSLSPLAFPHDDHP
jgi:hypothetical protein